MGYFHRLLPGGTLKLEEKDMANQTQAQLTYRARLWSEFVAHYQVVLISAPETFSEYCAKFRERWVRGY